MGILNINGLIKTILVVAIIFVISGGKAVYADDDSLVLNAQPANVTPQTTSPSGSSTFINTPTPAQVVTQTPLATPDTSVTTPLPTTNQSNTIITPTPVISVAPSSTPIPTSTPLITSYSTPSPTPINNITISPTPTTSPLPSTTPFISTNLTTPLPQSASLSFDPTKGIESIASNSLALATPLPASNSSEFLGLENKASTSETGLFVTPLPTPTIVKKIVKKLPSKPSPQSLNLVVAKPVTVMTTKPVAVTTRRAKSVVEVMPGLLYRSFPKEDISDSFTTLKKALTFQDQAWGSVTWLSIIGLSGYSAVTQTTSRKKRRRLF